MDECSMKYVVCGSGRNEVEVDVMSGSGRNEVC